MTKADELDSRIAAGNAETGRRAAEKFILGVHLDELAMGFGMPKKALERLIRIQLLGMKDEDCNRILNGQGHYAPWTL